MKEWKIDLPVLCIFWARPEQFKQTFEQVKKARPRVLLLWQDGPRPGREDDIQKIMQCREIAEDIYWDCEVHKMYNEKNYGCDPSTFYSHKWAFSIVDKCLILEDDVVVSQSAFPYTKELLDRYENDDRINRICLMNNIGELENCPYDYFFSSTGSVWGWATWRRVAHSWEEDYAFLKDDYHINLLYKTRSKKTFPNYVRGTKAFAATGIPHWENILSFSAFLNNRLNIIPTKNMVESVGVSENATHSVSSMKYLPKASAKIFKPDKFELKFPLKHPKYVVDNLEFRDKYFRVMGNGHPFVRLYRKIVSRLKRLWYKIFK